MDIRSLLAALMERSPRSRGPGPAMLPGASGQPQYAPNVGPADPLLEKLASVGQASGNPRVGGAAAERLKRLRMLQQLLAAQQQNLKGPVGQPPMAPAPGPAMPDVAPLTGIGGGAPGVSATQAIQNLPVAVGTRQQDIEAQMQGYPDYATMIRMQQGQQ